MITRGDIPDNAVPGQLTTGWDGKGWSIGRDYTYFNRDGERDGDFVPLDGSTSYTTLQAAERALLRFLGRQA